MIVLNDSISESAFLTSSHLALLAQQPGVPEIDPAFEDDVLKNIFQYYSLSAEELEQEVHKYAGRLLDEGKVFEAWQVLLSVG